MNMNDKLDIELSNFRIPSAREVFKKFLVAPQRMLRSCKYTGKKVEVELVARVTNYLVVHREFVEDCWGLVLEESDDLSTSDFWFKTLEDVFYASEGWNHELPEDYEVQ